MSGSPSRPTRSGDCGEFLVRRNARPVPGVAAADRLYYSSLAVIATLPALVGILALTVGDAEIFLPPSDAPATVTPTPKSCAAPEHRQFDFWIGEWTVTQPEGRTVGTNRISKILGGCALREEWTGVSGGSGTSLNMYDAARRRWHQTWVDDKGNVLLLDGEFKRGTMALEGDAPDSDGKMTRQRIVWSPLSGGRVRQLWESSADDGKSWKVKFDGTYTRSPSSPAERGR